MNYTVGYNSSGKLVVTEVLLKAHLFVSYIEYRQITRFFTQFSKENEKGLTKCLLIGKEEISIILPDSPSINKYIIDNPERGNIKTVRRLFTTTHRILVKRKSQKKSGYDPLLVLIDDIWQLVPKLNKVNISKLKDLLGAGASFGIFLVIGSTLPYRNLLVQLMQPGKSNHSPVNETGAEMIINPDGLIFFRETGELEFKTFYPDNMIYDV